MTPWEQHAKVISIPRFDYNAPSSLLQRSHSGFLITCTIKREKSATKEVIPILEKYIRSCNDNPTSKCVESPETNAETKRRKICSDEIGRNVSNVTESEDTTEDAGGLPKDECTSQDKTDLNASSDHGLSLVKLTRSGLLLLTFPKENSADPTAALLDIFKALESGNLKSPLWCHRIFPIQATCNLNEKELRAVVSKLVLKFVNERQNLSHPVKFAVAFNRRGIEQTEAKVKKTDQIDSLDRKKCFGVVAGAVKEIISDSTVDLKSPELSVLVELLPLSGIPNGSQVVAVSVLPQNLVGTKPRLCIKPLVSDKP